MKLAELLSLKLYLFTFRVDHHVEIGCKNKTGRVASREIVPYNLYHQCSMVH